MTGTWPTGHGRDDLVVRRPETCRHITSAILLGDVIPPGATSARPSSNNFSYPALSTRSARPRRPDTCSPRPDTAAADGHDRPGARHHPGPPGLPLPRI